MILKQQNKNDKYIKNLSILNKRAEKYLRLNKYCKTYSLHYIVVKTLSEINFSGINYKLMLEELKRDQDYLSTYFIQSTLTPLFISTLPKLIYS